MSRTEWSGSSVKRVARMAPAEPAPTMIVSYVLGILGALRWGCVEGIICRFSMPPSVRFHSSQLNRSATQANSICAARTAQLPPQIPHNHAISFTLQLAWTPVLDIFQCP